MKDFHISFIRELGLVVLVTIVSMISVRLFLYNYIQSNNKTPEYTSTESQINIDSDQIEVLRPGSH